MSSIGVNIPAVVSALDPDDLIGFFGNIEKIIKVEGVTPTGKKPLPSVDYIQLTSGDDEYHFLLYSPLYLGKRLRKNADVILACAEAFVLEYEHTPKLGKKKNLGLRDFVNEKMEFLREHYDDTLIDNAVVTMVAQYEKKTISAVVPTNDKKTRGPSKI